MSTLTPSPARAARAALPVIVRALPLGDGSLSLNIDTGATVVIDQGRRAALTAVQEDGLSVLVVDWEGPESRVFAVPAEVRAELRPHFPARHL